MASYRWQYNGIALFDDITAWCRLYLNKATISYLNETIYFFDEKDYAFFLLRWS